MMASQLTCEEKWETDVRTLLRAGYGADDIALLLGTDPQPIRTEIETLRTQGQLKPEFFNGKD